MAAAGWRQLIPGQSPFLGEDRYRIDAYSEFMPPPRLGWKPYNIEPVDAEIFSPDDPHGWHVGEFEEALQLQPGLLQVGQQVMNKLGRLLDNDPNTGLPKLDLADNEFWPSELAAETKLPQERCVVILPLALSMTLDDKGRIRWTLFGNSEQGPSKAFWRSFHPNACAGPASRTIAAKQGVDFFSRLLNAVYAEKIDGADSLRRAGFRILPDNEPLFDFWNEGRLPDWADSFLLSDHFSLAKVRYLLTFRPFGRLPPAVRKAYLTGKLCLLPFPGSLTFWGVSAYHRLHRELPLALQVPLLLNIARHRAHAGMRVPQSGFLHEPTADHPHSRSHAAHLRNTFKRTHRWDKILRDQDELALITKEDKMLHVLFSTIPDDLDLYGKPMARNIELWTDDNHLLLDGPNATPEQLKRALETTEAGGSFGYRFMFPAMRVGRHEVYWHRPLVAYKGDGGEANILPDAPLGWMTAYSADKPDLAKPIELWPRLHRRPLPLTALTLNANAETVSPLANVRNVRKLFETAKLLGREKLSHRLAQQLLALPHGESLDGWLNNLTTPALAEQVRFIIEPEPAALTRRRGAKVPTSLTYRRTARRSFEVAYWKTIASLAEGKLLNKNNADCVLDETTQRMLPYHERQLENLGDYLLAYYSRKIAAAGMTGKALAGEVPFRWHTDFDYSWMGGWLKNLDRDAERDLLIMIPGRDRSQAVIMADHYDTAYMADRYDKDYGGCGARLAACGADDNHSATAAMMLAAPIFLEMSRKGELDCDIWLVHLTGEEFPADCLGARALTQRLVERTLQLHLPKGKTKDLSNVMVRGLYVSDMIAHNNDRDRDIFQISPGTGRQSMWLAWQAHQANEIWNESVPEWNKGPSRAGKLPGRRSPHGGAIPEIAPFLAISGQVRPSTDPRSTLYNTDGQIFSDAGVPCVLFMENYDINRTGYHDSQDTMANIDLDYGAALCAITVESVARAATIRPGEKE